MFATIYFVNIVKSTISSSQNVNHTFPERTISRRNYSSSELRFLGAFCINKRVSLLRDCNEYAFSVLPNM